MKTLWYLRWKLYQIKKLLKVKYDPGYHRFVKGQCSCGQLTTDDPSICRDKP